MKQTRTQFIEESGHESFRALRLQRIRQHLPQLDEESYLTGFIDGGRNSDKNPKYKQQDLSERSYEYAKTYAVEGTKPLSKYFEDALNEQIEIDRQVFEKRFNLLADRLFERVEEIIKFVKQNKPDDELVIEKENILNEVKGVYFQ